MLQRPPPKRRELPEKNESMSLALHHVKGEGHNSSRTYQEGNLQATCCIINSSTISILGNVARESCFKVHVFHCLCGYYKYDRTSTSIMNHLRIILENTCYLRSNIKVLRAINKLNCYEPAYAQKSNGLPGLGNVCPAPHSQNVITQAISGKIIKDAVRRAILDTIGPVVARAAYTAVAITANTVYKDLA